MQPELKFNHDNNHCCNQGPGNSDSNNWVNSKSADGDGLPPMLPQLLQQEMVRVSLDEMENEADHFPNCSHHC